jgi:LTXXQ motif family protein
MLKSKVIVVFLLYIVTASQTASADNADVPTDVPAITPVTPRAPRDLLRDCELEIASIVGLRADIVRSSALRTDPGPSLVGETILVEIPFSSLQLSPSLVECLGLTPTQVEAIQKLMDQERPTAEWLMHELQTTSSELRATIQERQNNNNEGATQRLAARQAHLLKQLMRSNSHLRQRINRVLSPRQRKKLDSFKLTSEVSVGEGN